VGGGPVPTGPSLDEVVKGPRKKSPPKKSCSPLPSLFPLPGPAGPPPRDSPRGPFWFSGYATSYSPGGVGVTDKAVRGGKGEPTCTPEQKPEQTQTDKKAKNSRHINLGRARGNCGAETKDPAKHKKKINKGKGPAHQGWAARGGGGDRAR